MGQGVEYNVENKKIRKQWFISMFFLFLADLFYMFYQDDTMFTYAWAYVIGLFLGFGWIWYWAYFTRGWRWLTLLLITMPISMLFSVFNMFNTMSVQKSTGIILLVISWGLTAWWYVMSLKLRRINHRQRNLSAKYLNEIEAWDKVESKELLQSRYDLLSKQYEALQKIAQEAYERRQKELS
jgi:hypothetical protein